MNWPHVTAVETIDSTLEPGAAQELPALSLHVKLVSPQPPPPVFA
jgi:hypothetical protein